MNGDASRPRRGPTAEAAALIIIAGVFAFWPAMHGGWMWDDTLDVTGNPWLRTVGGLGRIWFHPTGLYDYYPLKYTVQWVQWQLWHTDTLGYHLTNLGLHLASALLVWRVLGRLGVSHAWLGGLLFAVHPLTVESVAWISELKNTLSLPLLLLSFERYLAYDAGRRSHDLAGAVALFAASMLCKTSGVMLPAALLLHAWWRRGRIRDADVKTTLPFFAVSLVFGVLTLWFQRHVAIGEAAPAFNPVGGLLARLACAGTAAAFYVGKFFVPVDLMPIYPQWRVDPAPWWTLLPWLTAGGLVAWFWSQRATWGRHALFAFGWFVLLAAPILGFVTITSQRFTWVMDHLAYVPMLGLVGGVTAAVGYAIDRLPRVGAWSVTGSALILAVVLMLMSHRHAAAFQSEQALWTDNVARNPDAWLAQFNLGQIAQDAGQLDAAIARYQTTLRLRPDYADAHYNLGNLQRDRGQTDAAVASYREALRLNPRHVLAHSNLGVTLARAGRTAAAVAEFEQAIALNPEYADGHYNLGSLLVGAGRAQESLPHFAATLRLNPAYPGAENNYAVALAAAGQTAEAVAHFEHALQRTPDDAATHNNFGATLRDLGRLPQAIEQFRAATRLRPDYANAWYNLGCAYGSGRDFAAAVPALERVVALAPNHVEARVSLAVALQALGRRDEALTQYEAARRLRPTLPPAR